MSPALRIQHYVPQFYLRQFAQKKRKNYYIKCFDKTQLKSFVANINRIACEAYFFDPPKSNPSTEKWLARLEKRFAKSYYRLIQHQELKKLATCAILAYSSTLMFVFINMEIIIYPHLLIPFMLIAGLGIIFVAIYLVISNPPTT